MGPRGEVRHHTLALGIPMTCYRAVVLTLSATMMGKISATPPFLRAEGEAAGVGVAAGVVEVTVAVLESFLEEEVAVAAAAVLRGSTECSLLQGPWCVWPLMGLCTGRTTKGNGATSRTTIT